MLKFLLALLLSVILICNLNAQSNAGFALSLDGNGDYVDFGTATSTNFDSSDFTVEFWLNKSSSREENIISKRELCNHCSFWGVSMTSYADFEMDQDGAGTNYYRVADTNDVVSNWNHIAFTRQDSIIKIYINSNLATVGNSGVITSINSTANLLIGNSICVGSNSSQMLTGMIDEVRLWKKCRTQAELLSTMYDTLGSDYYSTADSALIGYWRFDALEDLGINGDGADDVRDLSVNGNHGDLFGDAVLDTSGALVSKVEDNPTNPEEYFLSQNYPNPFNPTTTISFYLPERSNASLRLFDVRGRVVKTLVNEYLSRGNHKVELDATHLASGAYYYILKTENYISEKKMLLVK